MAGLTMVVLKFITVDNGAPFVMMIGISVMPTWCVVSLVSPERHPILIAQVTVRGLILDQGIVGFTSLLGELMNTLKLQNVGW